MDLSKRPRRLRSSPALRALVRETAPLAADNFIYDREALQSWARRKATNRTMPSPLTGTRMKLHTTPVRWLGDVAAADADPALQPVVLRRRGHAALAAEVAADPARFRDASDEARNVVAVARGAVTRAGWNLRHAGPAPKADRSVVLAAVTDCPAAIADADPSLAENAAIVLAAMRREPAAILFASPELRARASFKASVRALAPDVRDLPVRAKDALRAVLE